MALALQREWLEAFIELYRSEPSLWKIKSKEYHDRNKKDAAYEKLICKLRELDPTATRESVIKKINNIRCSYKKEYKKVIASMNSSSDNVYEPKLWYYPLLSFLDSQEASRMSHSDSDGINEINTLKLTDGSSGASSSERRKSEEDWKLECLNIKSRDSVEPAPISNTSYDHSWSPKINSEASVSKDVLFVQQLGLPSQEDKFDIVGKLVSLKLRSLSREQGLLAEKIINETLFEAELGNLSNTYQVSGRARGQGAVTCAVCEGLLDLPVPVLQCGNTVECHSLDGNTFDDYTYSPQF